jgi:hypothetical protein
VPLTVDGADTFVPPNYLKGFAPTDRKEIYDGLTVSTYLRKENFPAWITD